MILKTVLHYGNFFDGVMATYIEKPVYERALSPFFMDAEGEDFDDILRGYALYKAKVFDLVPGEGKYVIQGSTGYYKDKRGKTVAIAKAKLLSDENSVEVTLNTGSKEFEEEHRDAFYGGIKSEMTLREFIDYLKYIGLSNFGGKAYANMDFVLPKVEETFPDFNKKLFIQGKLDLLETATEKCAGDESVYVLGTKIVSELIEDDLVRSFKKKVEKGDKGYITYHQKETYKEGDRIKFINYSWTPRTEFGIREVGTSMSLINLRDMMLGE